MEQDGGAISKKVEDFLNVFKKGEEFTQELLKQNEMLRFKLAQLERSTRHAGPVRGTNLSTLEQRLQALEEENRELLN